MLEVDKFRRVFLHPGHSLSAEAEPGPAMSFDSMENVDKLEWLPLAVMYHSVAKQKRREEIMFLFIIRPHSFYQL